MKEVTLILILSICGIFWYREKQVKEEIKKLNHENMVGLIYIQHINGMNIQYYIDNTMKIDSLLKR